MIKRFFTLKPKSKIISNRTELSAREIRNQLMPERKFYIQNATSITRKIEELLSNRKIQIHQVTYRIKSLDSAIKKIQSKSVDYSPQDLTDVLGIRVIVFKDSDVSRSEKCLRAEFNYDPDNTIDKTIPKDITSFGYKSFHLVLKMIGTEHRPLPFEVQIRTVLQHAWAELEHSAIYKANHQVSPDLRRRFARLAGTLELLDAEIDRILEEPQ